MILTPPARMASKSEPPKIYPSSPSSLLWIDAHDVDSPAVVVVVFVVVAVVASAVVVYAANPTSSSIDQSSNCSVHSSLFQSWPDLPTRLNQYVHHVSLLMIQGGGDIPRRQSLLSL